MKLKQKLAMEYARHVRETDEPRCDAVNVAHDWLQGFEKGLEMAAKAVATSSFDCRCWDIVTEIGQDEAGD